MIKLLFSKNMALFLILMSNIQAFDASNEDIYELKNFRVDIRSILDRNAVNFEAEKGNNLSSRPTAINPYNACIWKICSRPLKNRKPLKKIEITPKPLAKQKTINLLSNLLKTYNSSDFRNEKWIQFNFNN